MTVGMTEKLTVEVTVWMAVGMTEETSARSEIRNERNDRSDEGGVDGWKRKLSAL